MTPPDPLLAAGLGLAVFALEPGGKLPRAPGWQSAATADPRRIAATWRPGDNIGVGCWKSRILGLDLDVKGGADGVAAFAAACDRHGAPWPTTLTVATPSGGLHLYFAVPAAMVIGSASGTTPLGPGVDVRGPGRGGRGGYLVGPGSIVGGRAYRVVREAPIAEVPAWLAALLSPASLRSSSPRSSRSPARTGAAADRCSAPPS